MPYALESESNLIHSQQIFRKYTVLIHYFYWAGKSESVRYTFGITFRFTAAFAHLAPAVGTIRKAAVRLQRQHGYFYPSQVLCLPPSLCEL